MVNIQERLAWNDIYKVWDQVAMGISPALFKPIDIKEIKFPYEGDYSVAGMDWIHDSDYEERIHFVTEHTTDFLFSGSMLRKGTLKTIEHLVYSNDDQEVQAAIWIYTFVKEIREPLPEKWDHQLIRQVEIAVMRYLNLKGIKWHHSMKGLVPEIYFSYLLDCMEINEIEPLIEIIALNSALLLKHYSIVYYESFTSDEVE